MQSRWLALVGALALATSLVSLPAAAQPAAPRAPRATSPSLRDGAPAGAQLIRTDRGRIRRAWGLALATSGGSAEDRALGVLSRYAHELAVARDTEWRALSVREIGGRTVVRLTRTWDGLDVIGSSAVVRIDREGRADYVAVAGAEAARVGGGFVISETAARARAPRYAGLHAGRVTSIAPAFLSLGLDLIPVWRALVQDAPHERVLVSIHARDGALRSIEPALVHARGWVFAHDPRTDTEPLTAELPGLTSAEHLENADFSVVSTCPQGPHCQSERYAVPDAQGDYLYDPSELSSQDPFAEVSAYYHLARYAAHMRARHDFMWSCGQFPLQVDVNYREAADEPYDNAWYELGHGPGRCGRMAFGQGSSGDYAYDADVVYHEASHVIIDQLANLELTRLDELGASTEPMAIHEGLSDYFAATIIDAPEVGAYCFEPSIRRLDERRDCDDRTGEAHDDGRVLATLAWALREEFGAEAIDELVFATLAALDGAPALRDFAETMIATAHAMASDGRLAGAAAAMIEARIEERALTTCARILPLEPCVARQVFVGHGLRLQGDQVASHQLSIEVPPEATSMTIELVGESANGEYRFHASVDEPVLFHSEEPHRRAEVVLERPPFGAPLVWDRDANPALPAGQVVYLAIEPSPFDTLAYYDVRVSFAPTTDPSCVPDEVDAGTLADAGIEARDAGPASVDAGTDAARADAGTDAARADAGASDVPPRADGCACRASAPASGAKSATMVLAALLALVRRRRVSPSRRRPA